MGALHLSSLIDLRLVFLKSPLQDLREIYRFMVKQKNRKYHTKIGVDELVERLMKRNLDEGILFPTGIAIPHLHLDDFGDTVISILVPEKPIQTEYGVIKIFFMVFTCKSDNSLYLHILQSLIKISKDTEFFEKLLSIKSPQEFQKTIKSVNLAVRKAMTVSDVMLSKVITVREDTTLKELSSLFYEHNFGYFPVLDKNDKVVGEITIRDYMMAAFPAYTNFMPNLNFLKSFEPFERLINDEANHVVKELMKPMEVSIKPDSSIIEAVFLINKHNKRDLPVLEDGKLVGIISFMNIFKKVIKG